MDSEFRGITRDQFVAAMKDSPRIFNRPEPIYMTEDDVEVLMAEHPEGVIPENPWCVAANVTPEPHLHNGEMILGTKHFAPGAQLYLLPQAWGDGGARMQVLGRHKGGGSRLIKITMLMKHVVNFRVVRVYQPAVITALLMTHRPWTVEDARDFVDARRRPRGTGDASNEL